MLHWVSLLKIYQAVFSVTIEIKTTIDLESTVTELSNFQLLTPGYTISAFLLFFCFYLLTFSAEHAVTEQQFCYNKTFLESSGQHRAGVCRQALAAQVQFRLLTSASLMKLRLNALLRLHSSLLTQTQVERPEVLHSGSAWRTALSEHLQPLGDDQKNTARLISNFFLFFSDELY